MTTIDLIRHGEPVGGRRYRGHLDDPLCDKGWQQMRGAVEGHDDWQHIVSSPLLRCAEFADELAGRLSISVTREPRLMEISFGEWEGLTADDIDRLSPGALMRFYEDPIAHRPEGAELLTDFHRRVGEAWQHLIDQHAGQHVLVVAHAGVIRAIVCAVLGMPAERMFSLQVSNAGITRIKAASVRGSVLEFHNASLPPS